MKARIFRKTRNDKTSNKFYFFVFTLFVALIIIPLLYVVGLTFFPVDSFYENLKLLNSEEFLLLVKSCGIASLIGIFSTLVGTALGFLLYKTDVKFKTFFKITFLIPLFISPYILAVAWKDFFFVVFSNTKVISSYFGLVWVLTTVYTPLSMLIVGSALSNINSQLEDAALVITNHRKTLFKIVLPLIKPALLTSFVIVFIFGISEFSVAAFFGVRVFTTEIFTQFSAFYNHSLAILQSLLLIVISILLLLTEGKYIADAPFFTIGSSGMKTKKYNLNGKNKFALSILFAWLFLSVIFPFTTLFAQSFYGGVEKFFEAFTLLAPSILNSLELAFAGALLIVIVGFTAAYPLFFKASKFKSFDWALLLIFAVPSTVFGISLIKFYNHPFLNFIYSSSAIIVIAYVGKFSFLAAKLTENSIKQIPPSLNEAAQIAGISAYSRLRKILLPLTAPALFASFIVGFIFSLGELGTTIMIYPPGTEIMPIKVFTIMANAPQSLTSSMALIVFLITLLTVSVFYFALKPFIKKFGFEK